MVGPDEQKPGVTRIVVDVKDTEPVLKSELVQFKSACEELENNYEGENGIGGLLGETSQAGRDLKPGGITQGCLPDSKFGEGRSNLCFDSEVRGKMSFQGGDPCSGVSVWTENDYGGGEESGREDVSNHKFSL